MNTFSCDDDDDDDDDDDKMREGKYHELQNS